MGTATKLQDDGTIFGRSNVQEIETEIMPFGKELKVAAPREAPDGMGLPQEGPLRRVQLQRVPIKLSGGKRLVKTGKKAVGRKRTISVKWSVSCQEQAICAQWPFQRNRLFE